PANQGWYRALSDFMESLSHKTQFQITVVDDTSSPSFQRGGGWMDRADRFVDPAFASGITQFVGDESWRRHGFSRSQGNGTEDLKANSQGYRSWNSDSRNAVSAGTLSHGVNLASVWREVRSRRVATMPDVGGDSGLARATRGVSPLPHSLGGIGTEEESGNSALNEDALAKGSLFAKATVALIADESDANSSDPGSRSALRRAVSVTVNDETKDATAMAGQFLVDEYYELARSSREFKGFPLDTGIRRAAVLAITREKSRETHGAAGDPPIEERPVQSEDARETSGS
ncbi:MAG TPA: hypothetical protein VIY86_02245, partial [Pirellulaceae bacterium]